MITSVKMAMSNEQVWSKTSHVAAHSSLQESTLAPSLKSRTNRSAKYLGTSIKWCLARLKL